LQGDGGNSRALESAGLSYDILAAQLIYRKILGMMKGIMIFNSLILCQVRRLELECSQIEEVAKACHKALDAANIAKNAPDIFKVEY
jgi:hypothetical protein